ncbi:hypothetical protein TVAG_189570 [Trichomonas vaginalis G3]|uniref:Uncharacterized protein n=1 Tax=Trichomonas vaginalis (strain ATCC PRA-98 / G3) TaxID=412133 RepID=A2F1R1_TRIV3|nr:glycoprotein 38 family [Trichomonas vaginalis G3]EAY01171.1 hypothetical protein TVAG_189570 [Trichomonas vaginalis G3]KAI5547198.1 glycoprotein 38 family [Trichomonas vaginalis G3]|eukprot:XP_001330118.1 hypothetical protein [Trichomonas vaginalis G3]
MACLTHPYYESDINALLPGLHVLKAGIYAFKKGYTVLLQPPAKMSKTNVYAMFGGEKYTLLKNNIIGIEFNESGFIYVNGKASIQSIVVSVSKLNTDDTLYLIGRGELRIGNMENVNYTIENQKNYSFVLSSFDGKGRSRMDGDVINESIEVKNYKADGTKIVNEESSRKLLAEASNPDNISVYSVQITNAGYKFSYKFKTMRSRDKDSIIINSQLGTHFLASRPDSYTEDETPTPTPAPTSESDGSKNGSINPAKLTGIVIGLIIVIAIVCVIIFFVLKKKRQAKHNDSEEGDVHTDESMYSYESA